MENLDRKKVLGGQSRKCEGSTFTLWGSWGEGGGGGGGGGGGIGANALPPKFRSH